MVRNLWFDPLRGRIHGVSWSLGRSGFPARESARRRSVRRCSPAQGARKSANTIGTPGWTRAKDRDHRGATQGALLWPKFPFHCYAGPQQLPIDSESARPQRDTVGTRLLALGESEVRQVHQLRALAAQLREPNPARASEAATINVSAICAHSASPPRCCRFVMAPLLRPLPRRTSSAGEFDQRQVDTSTNNVPCGPDVSQVDFGKFVLFLFSGAL